MDARNLWRSTTRRSLRPRGLLLQPPPRPATDARLTRFTTLLDALTEGERVLALARQMVEVGNPAQAERSLSDFVASGREVLEQTHDLPGDYVDLLGQTLARCLVARAAARVEQALSGEPGADVLLRSARYDADAVEQLPAGWLDQKTRSALARVRRVLEPVAA